MKGIEVNEDSYISVMTFKMYHKNRCVQRKTTWLPSVALRSATQNLGSLFLVQTNNGGI